MFTKEDILARMGKGDSIEDIAAEITDILNAANTEFEAQKAISDKRAKKMELAKQFNAIIKEYITLENPDMVKYMTSDDEDLDTMIDSLDNLIGTLKFFSTMADITAQPDPSARKANVSVITDDDDILSNFIAKICH